MESDISLRYNFKIIIGSFVILYGVVTLLFFNFYRELALKDARQEAVFVLDTMNAIRDYVSIIQRPLVEELKEKHGLDPDFFDPRLLSSSYIAREIYNIQRAKKNINYDYSLTAHNPLNPEHEGSVFEKRILDDFKEGKYKEYSKIIQEEGTSYFFVGLPIRNSHPSCSKCHIASNAPKGMLEQYPNLGPFESKVGEVIAMISFKIPVWSILTYHTKEFMVGGTAMFVVFTLFVLFIYKIHKKDRELEEKTQMLMISQNRLASMGEMIGNISHQWRQPLAQVGSILVNLELYSEKEKLTHEKLSRKIQEANEQLAFMSSTIDDFRDFFRPQKEKKVFSVQEVIGQSKRLLSASLEKFGIEVEVKIEENFRLEGYPNEIAQVMINIINNAKEAFLESPQKNRRVVIRAFVSEGVATISISNNAGLIQESVLEHIFEPYFTTKESGSGLGLYMSQKVAEKNHALLEAKNTADGVCFTLSFNSFS